MSIKFYQIHPGEVKSDDSLAKRLIQRFLHLVGRKQYYVGVDLAKSGRDFSMMVYGEYDRKTGKFIILKLKRI